MSSPALAAAVVTALLALSSPAVAAEPDPFSLFFDGLTGGLQAQDRPRVCPELAGGTAGAPEPGAASQAPDAGNGLAPGDSSGAPRSLPDAVYLRSTRRTYNRRYWFALAAGRIYFKSNAEQTGIEQPWAELEVPSCFSGRVRKISADDDELIALSRNRQVFTMDGALSAPAAFNWTVRWGPLFWTGAGRRIPMARTWSWSVSSPREDRTFTDSAGNEHAFGEGKVSHIWLLHHRRQRLTYLDPWLAVDQSYEMCGPRRGRLRSVGMSASGSSVFVINRYGDMFTRLYDFDISGADSVFFEYSYEDQRGRSNPAIQLPSPGWVRQPKIRGTVTSAISIHKEGVGSVRRRLRVEGRHRGNRGFWEKDIAARGSRSWKFVPTGQKLTRRILDNTRRDHSSRDLGPSENRRYNSDGGPIHATIPNFHIYCSPARIEVDLGQRTTLRLRLHTVDAIRLTPRARGLDDEPRLVQGTIEAPDPVLESDEPAIRAFRDEYLTGGRFTAARIDATLGSLEFPSQGWRFEFAPRASR